jgi:2-polyprenyl-6-methoxyphenol hydroxylase-like FAD-dependent oxidoreductase
MGASSRQTEDVLIVGAGPTGLVLALWLARLGVRPRIIDKSAEPGTTSRALGVQARTLELYRQIGLADEVIKAGRAVMAANLWVTGKHAARADFGAMGAGISPFPYAVIYPQDEHERMLVKHLSEMGIEVERRTELVGLEDGGLRMFARIEHADGSEETCETRYVAGCDGAHSPVREAMGIGFAGAAYQHLFYVADVSASGPAMNGELNIALDYTDFLAVFPLEQDGHARLVGTIRDEPGAKHEDLKWDDVSQNVIQRMRVNVESVNWFSAYRVHHRVAEHFSKGRAFLLGDAAHIHSPVGAQGMNTGIGDAVNLAWKLAATIHERASAAVLDTYEPERIAFAKRLVSTTDKAFTGVTSSSVLARFIRLQLVPHLFGPLFRVNAARRLMFRAISQTGIEYRRSWLSYGKAGKIRGGDRLPWVNLATDGAGKDNFAPLESLDWQAHVCGSATADLEELCRARNLPLHVFAWQPVMEYAGLARDAVYVIRPDGYIGLADKTGSPTAVASYLDARGIVLAGDQTHERHVSDTSVSNRELGNDRDAPAKQEKAPSPSHA